MQLNARLDLKNLIRLALAVSFVNLVAHASEARAQDDDLSTPVKVLQNRYFLKAMRPEVSLFGGTVLNEAYSKTYAYGARVGNFFTEYFGLDYAYTRFTSQDSADLNAIRAVEYCSDVNCEQKKRLEPSFVRLESAHSVLATLAPIYSKTSLFSQYILYSDIYFSAGVAQLSTSQGNKTAFVGGFGQRFYFAKSFNIRLDGWDHIFTEERQTLNGTKSSTRHAWVVALGVSAFLRDGGDDK